MKVLVIGNGGREHAMAWKLALSPLVDKIFVAPGNAGTRLEDKTENVDIDVGAIQELINFSKMQSIDLCLVGPEAPLAAGIVDAFTAEGIACFGPTQAAAQLESSKTFSKDFMAKHQIPTATYQTFSDLDKAIAYIKSEGTPIVVKADGLAAGKGVVVATTEQQAITAVTDMLAGNQFGEAGHRVVIEEFLAGEELSYIVMTDGESIIPLATSQDHKARDDGDKGPNTGGMGAYSPAPIATPDLEAHILDTIIKPTLAALKSEGITYRGFLYAGLMLDSKKQPRVLEFNCRFGDPETQPILMRLKTDFFVMLLHAMAGRLHKIDVQWDERAALGVVMASGGYPYNYRKGDPITGIEKVNTDAIKVFHAGTTYADAEVRTNGGRVLCVTALGKTIAEAQQLAYGGVQKIQWPDAFYRQDIGNKALKKATDHAEKIL